MCDISADRGRQQLLLLGTETSQLENQLGHNTGCIAPLVPVTTLPTPSSSFCAAAAAALVAISAAADLSTLRGGMAVSSQSYHTKASYNYQSSDVCVKTSCELWVITSDSFLGGRNIREARRIGILYTVVHKYGGKKRDWTPT